MARNKPNLKQTTIAFTMILAARYAPAECVDRGFSTLENQVLNSYIAYYGRPADPQGLSYWAKRLDDEGGSLGSIINAFGVSQEFDERYGDLSAEELITNLYQQLFNRDPEPGGFDYWLDQYISGARTLQNIALALLDGAQNEDLEIVTNRNVTARHFVTQSECAGLELPESTYNSLMTSVNELTSSATSACDMVDDSIESQGGVCSHDTWTRKADLPVAGVASSTCVVGGKLYVMGLGWGAAGTNHNKVAEYDPKADSWTLKAEMLQAQSWGTASAVNGKCYVMGGGQLFRPSKRVQVYDPNANSWRDAAPLPEQCGAQASAAIGGKIYAVGGGKEWAWIPATMYSSVCVYDPAADQWTIGADIPTPRAGMVGGAIDGYLYVVGGSNAQMRTSDLVHRYDPVQNTWTARASLPVKVDWATAGVLGESLYVIGGFVPDATGSNFDTTTSAVYRYDPNSDRWTQVTDMAEQRYGAGSGNSTVAGRVFVVGGRAERESAALTVVEEYTP